MVDGDDPEALPLLAADLERLRFRARREMPAAGLAGVRRRRIGQSLEYRDHRAYVLGDDVRTIDWRASERLPDAHDLLVRNFEAEERFTVALAVDNRPAMMLPEAAPAALVARWIVEATAVIATREQLAVRFLPLFAGGPEPSRPAAGKAVAAAARGFCAGIGRGPFTADEPALATAAIAKVLPPACALIVVTTATFADPHGRFRSLLASAGRGFRQVVVAVLDPWPFERALLEGGSVAIDAAGGAGARDGVFDPSGAELDTSATALEQHRAALLAAAPARFSFPWPATTAAPVPALRASFRRAFMEFAVTTQLFARQAR